ncbi:MAG: hypothetical protein ACTSP9_17915 [Promethearchaeota archaeon]
MGPAGWMELECVIGTANWTGLRVVNILRIFASAGDEIRFLMIGLSSFVYIY